MRYRISWLAAAVVALAACTPTLDWRQARPEASGVSLLLPCKPSAMTRTVPLAGQVVRLSLHACTADGQTWALGFADVGAPDRVTAALEELRRAAEVNLGSVGSRQTLPLTVPGATPNTASGRIVFGGTLPDGTKVQEQVAVFTHGTLVYQATVIGERLSADGIDTFFTSLRVGG